MPLLERVIRRALLLPWPVYLATTVKASDDPLVALAARLGVAAFRGSEDRVLERAVLAAECFGLEAFARVCGDRPLFPLDELLEAAVTMRNGRAVSESCREPDLVTNRLRGDCAAGLTTEVIRTAALRRILGQAVSAHHQEHLTSYLYDHADEFVIVGLPPRQGTFDCPGFAVDTESDLARLDRILTLVQRLDLEASEADRMFHS